jgi:hypothetical protein
MFSILFMLLVLSLSILVTRIASISLTYTGLSRETAKFQARSAFTGVGFTTNESEKVVGHPVRRRILLLLMLLGNAGIITAMSSLILTFVDNSDPMSLWLRLVLLLSGVAALWSLAASRRVDRAIAGAVNWALRRYTDLGVKDYHRLLHLGGEYGVSELQVQEEDWVAGKRLAQSRLKEEGIIVLGITRKDGVYVGTPDGDTQVTAGDIMVLYGRAPVLRDVDLRTQGVTGEYEHAGASAKHYQVQDKEKQEDQERMEREEMERKIRGQFEEEVKHKADTEGSSTEGDN